VFVEGVRLGVWVVVLVVCVSVSGVLFSVGGWVGVCDLLIFVRQVTGMIEGTETVDQQVIYRLHTILGLPETSMNISISMHSIRSLLITASFCTPGDWQ